MNAHPERLFLFRLARELGYTVSRLLNELDSREISEWMAFFNIEQEEREQRNKPDPQVLSSKLKATLGIGAQDDG